ncbi:DNA-processing protein DprA [Geminisphaera colitermitum]|uniref:DNA-processing protein DprA n=1 Tax=Geminisphaera colitermitum TaxID=1148786 RepID=UPI000158D0B3|nr:DNA-processing protein DprA [Geminisphaera colitermitum]
MLTETQAYLILNALPDIGPITTNRLLDALGGDPRAILDATPAQLEQVKGVGARISGNILNWRAHFDLAREEDRMAQSGVRFIPRNASGYPALLREIPSPPVGLYQKGNYAFDRPAVAIVGTRRTTLYGQATAKKLASELARLGFCIVSGLARGIDSCAHEGALLVNGATAAVLGTGIDIIYPPENLDLYRRIENEGGAICSEFPFTRRADRQSFAMRNRIVAGMCSAIIVVESDVSGGSMITARFAGEQGRLVFAVPGRIDQPGSAGCHQLIRDGATLLTCVDDLLNEINYLDGMRPQPIPAKGSDAGDGGDTPAHVPSSTLFGGDLTDDEQRLLACFAGGAMPGIDTLTAQTGLPAHHVSSTLMMLELKRLIAKRADGTFEARSRSR